MNKKILIILSIIVVAILTGFMVYRAGMFSKEILKLDILGPDTAKIGDEVQYAVVYKNNGNFVLQSPKLIFQLPEDSLTEDGKTIFTQNVKDIYPGGQDSISFRVRLLGKDGDLKTLKASLSLCQKT